MKNRVILTDDEKKMFRKLLMPNVKGRLKPSQWNQIETTINKRKPPHTRSESWVTFSYTTRWNLIQDWELKQLRQQQQELFDRLKAEAEAKSST